MESTRDTFERLADEWVEGRPRGADIAAMTAHPAYQSIIAIGEDAVPWMLNRMTAEPDHWFVALSAVTGASPVPTESRGRIKEMTTAWLQWGHERGYIDLSPTHRAITWIEDRIETADGVIYNDERYRRLAGTPACGATEGKVTRFPSGYDCPACIDITPTMQTRESVRHALNNIHLLRVDDELAAEFAAVAKRIIESDIPRKDEIDD